MWIIWNVAWSKENLKANIVCYNVLAILLYLVMTYENLQY